MPRSMIPFPYSPWPFLDFGSDPDLNGTPPTPNVPGVTIPWSALPPIAPPPSIPPPVVPPPNLPAPQPTLPPSDTPGFDKAIARINAPTPGFHLTPGLGGFT